MREDTKQIFAIKAGTAKLSIHQILTLTKPTPQEIEDRQRRLELEENIRKAKSALASFSYKPPGFFERMNMLLRG